MDEANLQIGIIAGQYINKVDLLAANNLRQALSVFMREHVQVGVRQFVTQNIDTINSAQNTDPTGAEATILRLNCSCSSRR
ncbi:Uncharacterised protein [Salmonella enterica subsp. enterica]|uniref:Uncharacterized protein n=1 Tax=Salmonella enterica I TaxID=59201 RepID=A0A379WRH5_SALET|nr:Uncharacterised protein [Salmonella enterica subsp. enterica]